MTPTELQIDLLPSDDVPEGCPRLVNWTMDERINISIKDQLMLHVCWAFVAVTLYEYARAIFLGKQMPFSAQQIVDNLVEDVPPGEIDDETRFLKSTNGAFRWIKKNGIALEAEYQYTGDKGPAGIFPPSNKEFRLSDYQKIDDLDEAGLLKQLASQPVAIAIDLYHSLRNLGDGIYSGRTNEKDVFLGRHALVLLGYGKDPATKKEVFIVQNSWGKRWGIGGLGKIERKRLMGICRFSYPVL